LAQWNHHSLGLAPLWDNPNVCEFYIWRVLHIYVSFPKKTESQCMTYDLWILLRQPHIEWLLANIPWYTMDFSIKHGWSICKPMIG
jgi:hypothetical protein